MISCALHETDFYNKLYKCGTWFDTSKDAFFIWAAFLILWAVLISLTGYVTVADFNSCWAGAFFWWLQTEGATTAIDTTLLSAFTLRVKGTLGNIAYNWTHFSRTWSFLFCIKYKQVTLLTKGTCFWYYFKAEAPEIEHWWSSQHTWMQICMQVFPSIDLQFGNITGIKIRVKSQTDKVGRNKEREKQTQWERLMVS